MPGPSKRMRIFAGPNGSGKSTVINEIKEQYYCGPYINADEIQLVLKQYASINLLDNYGLSFTTADFINYIQTSGSSWEDKAAGRSIPVNIFSENNCLKVKDAAGPYDAAIAADFIRRLLLLKGETFTFETVFSHASKL